MNITIDSLKKHYIESIENIHEAKKYVLIAIIIFISGISIGSAYYKNFGDLFESYAKVAMSFKDLGPLALIAAIFIRNNVNAVLSILLGSLVAIVPVISAVINGILMGVIISVVSSSGNALILLKLIPHGIFELPAAFLAWGLGIWRGVWYFQKGEHDSFQERRKKSFQVYFMIIMPLLFVAATIEGLGIIYF